MARVGANSKILAIVLAGGEGKRLMPLTRDRAKPAVPFGGIYRLIDFALSNVVNSGYLKVVVLTQYKSHSLDKHVTKTWRMSTMLGNYVAPVPAQQRVDKNWYLGSADAIFQSLNLLDDERPEIVVVVGADHVYRMDPEQMIKTHIESGAGVSVAGIRMHKSQSSDFGVIETGPDGKTISKFLEEPANPPTIPGDDENCYVSMGNYVFTTETLIEVLKADAADPASVHDMGGNIIPMLTEQGLAQVYDINLVHLGVIFIANLELGYLHPPLGLNLLLASVRFKKPVLEVMWATMPMLGILALGVLLITYFPWLTLGLLEWMGRL